MFTHFATVYGRILGDNKKFTFCFVKVIAIMAVIKQIYAPVSFYKMILFLHCRTWCHTGLQHVLLL